ncbi:MAG: beta-1,6-N-acetylglucosaminyltransferase [Rubricella sp.]
MSVGISIIAHQHLTRVSELARHLATNGCRVAIHVDKATPDRDVRALRESLSDEPGIIFARRLRCEWGTFALNAAALETSRVLLETYPDVSHVCLVSGSCLPVRPVGELQAFLADHPDTDFVESHVVGREKWVRDGLEEERFTLFHPFSWRRSRWLFDRSVDLQRMMGVRRAAPPDLELSVGSQWWTLTRRTLEAILNDPRRRRWDSFFRKCWIVDESYIQTLVRLHSRRHENRSLTLTEFDPQGKPFTFYDDHAEILEQTECFFARKVWHGANALYSRYLHGAAPLAARRRRAGTLTPEDLPAMVARGRAIRCEGRSGLLSQSRFPCTGFERQPATACRYLVLDGVDTVLDDVTCALRSVGVDFVHGRLFGAADAELGCDAPGGLVPGARPRDWAREQFLTQLLWHRRDGLHAFRHSLADDPGMMRFVLADPNAIVVRVNGAWIVENAPRSSEETSRFRALSKRMDTLERAHRVAMAKSEARADVIEVSLDEVIRDPSRALAALDTGVARLMGRGQGVLVGQPTPALRRIADLPKIDLPGASATAGVVEADMAVGEPAR